jgi:predicted nucleotidyltransferase
MNQKKLTSVKVEELERAYEKCLIFFYAFPRRTIGLTDLAKSIKSSKTATKEAVESLIKQDFLVKEVAGRAWILSTNQKHPYFLTKKVPYHLDKIYESGVVEAVHNSFPGARAVVLFGSYRWGDDTEESDIDIAVEILDNHEVEITKLGIIEQLGYRKKVPVNLHIFSRNKIDLNLFANIANGIVLSGFLEVRV